MNNLIEHKISQIIETNRVFQNEQTPEQAKHLLIESLQVLDTVIQELVRYFLAISTQTGSNSQLISDKVAELRGKSEELAKLTNWLRTKEGDTDPEGHRRKVIRRIGVILVQIHTVIIESRSKIVYQAEALLNTNIINENYEKGPSLSIVLLTIGQFIYTWAIQCYQTIKNWLIFLMLMTQITRDNRTNRPELLTGLAHQQPEIVTTDSPTSDGPTVQVASDQVIRNNIDQMNLFTNQFEQLIAIASNVRKWVNNLD